MSVAASRAVWASAPVGGGELLVLLALADHADEGGLCWPSATTLAAHVRLSKRQVLRHLLKLEDRGLLFIERRAGPAATNRYRLTLPQLVVTPTTPRAGDTGVTADDTSPVTPASPPVDDAHDTGSDTHDTTLVTPTTAGGDAGVTRSVRDPSLTSFLEIDNEANNQTYLALQRLHARFASTRSRRVDTELRGLATAGLRHSDVALIEEDARDYPNWPYVVAILRRVQGDRAAGREPWPERAPRFGPSAAGGPAHARAVGPRSMASRRASGIPSVRYAKLVPGPHRAPA